MRLRFGFLFLLLVCSSAFGMGEIPSTIEVVNPTIEYSRDFGRPGSGDGQFYYPNDVNVAMTGDVETGLGNILVVDTGNNRVVKLDENGNFIYQFGGFGIQEGKFNAPMGITVDFNSRIYVSEKDNDRVQLFDIRGNFISPVATDEVNSRALTDPAGMTVDPMGNLFVADSGNDRVIKFYNHDQVFPLVMGAFGYGAGFFDKPMDVAVDRDRNIYVADTNNHRIQKMDFDGRPLLSFGKAGSGPGELRFPQSLTVDDRFIYVSDTGNHRICLFDKKGEFILSFGRQGQGRGEFFRPAGICLGRKGKLFVADSGNHRIVELKLATPPQPPL